MNEEPERLNIAVVGGGAAGLAAAYLLQRRHNVTVYEKNDYVGGHIRTVVLTEGPDAGTPIDTGFSVMNRQSYPLLSRLFTELSVPLRNGDMSFGMYDQRTNLQYANHSLNGLFAQRRNLLRPSFWRMIVDLRRFYRQATFDLAAGAIGDRTLGAYLNAGGYSKFFIDDYILPMGSALWFTPCDCMLEFPAAAFIQFFANRGLLKRNDKTQWKTISGGGRAYVDHLTATLYRPVRVNSEVSGIRRGDDGIRLTLVDGRWFAFDRVVIACHADEALALLEDPSDTERDLLGAWNYTHNSAVLHHDISLMPPNPRAWASWNYVRETTAGNSTSPVSLTCDMNRLEGLETRRHYFVSVNRQTPVPERSLLAQHNYTHPVFTIPALAAQARLPELNGPHNTYYCGSYFGLGSHEDAVSSAVQVARHFDIAFG